VDELPRHPYIINLWASWCLPCQREAPRLADAAAAARGQVNFLGINTQDDRNSALDFLHYVGIHYPQLFDPDGDVLHRLGVPGIPVTLAVDSTGHVVYRRVGEISKSDLSAAVRAANRNAASSPAMTG
jgi:thiol-disulfide isomerase/thioredoxin